MTLKIIWANIRAALRSKVTLQADRDYWKKSVEKNADYINELRGRCEELQRKNLELLIAFDQTRNELQAWRETLSMEICSKDRPLTDDSRIAYVPIFAEFPFARTYDDAKTRAATFGYQPEAIVRIIYDIGQFDGEIKNEANPPTSSAS